MNVEEHYFEAYVDAIKLCRWFILIVVLLSGLLLVQLYVEESNEGKIEEQRDLIHHVWAKELGLTPVSIVNTSNITERLNILKGLHFYETASFGEQRLPLLDFTVPGDYYETILSILLAVFSVGVWLNVRSVLATRSLLLDNITNKEEERNLRQLLRVYRVFNNLEPKKIVAIFLRWGAFLVLPAGSLLLALALDLDVGVHSSRELAHHVLSLSERRLHITILCVSSAVTFAFGLWSIRYSTRVDHQDHAALSKKTRQTGEGITQDFSLPKT